MTGERPMKLTFNIYFDESCHLKKDGQQAMVLGAVWGPLEQNHDLAEWVRRRKTNARLERDY